MELVTRTLRRLGDLARETGAAAAAEAYYTEATNLARRLGLQRDLAHVLLGQGMLLVSQGQADQARLLFAEAARLFTILHAPERRQAEASLRALGEKN